MQENTIPFNKPFVAGRELDYIAQSVECGNIAADGRFTKACSELLCRRFGIRKALLVPSCTAALEMAAMLCRLQPGDEVIVPSYTFVSTANAFVRQGAKPVFVDIRPDTLNIDETLIEDAITTRTKVIVPVHYAGVACEMDAIMEIANRHNLVVVEDAAQGVHAYYYNRPLGTMGQFGTYSFHETKNYICGEGGALCIRDEPFIKRAEIIRDKGTNRKEFFRGNVDKYTWVDVGSSYAISELSCAFLFGQLELLDEIAARRQAIYKRYEELVKPMEDAEWLRMPHIPDHCSTNYHMFYLLLPSTEARDGLLAYLNERGICAVFHYVPLHTSPMGQKFGCQLGDFPVAEDVAARLLRLPFFYEVSPDEQQRVVEAIESYLTTIHVHTLATAVRKD